MARRKSGKDAPAPGTSEFSHGAGLTPPDATRYIGTVARQTVSDPNSRESRRLMESATPGRPV